MSDGPFAMARTCAECPWRRDVPTGKFPPERYIALADTCAPGGLAPVFACHMTPDGGERACAGMLAACGMDSNRVRLAVAFGLWKPGEAEAAGPLFASFPAMAEANGVPADHPALDPWRRRPRRRA